MPRISKAKIVFFILMIEAILSLSFFNLYADTQVKPQRPWYSETPNPRHIANYDRLTAEYFNNQLNVIYNWAQNTNAELDNLLHNGIGVASLTVGILNCTNKIINPEWDNLLHNGNGVASITANLVKAQDLEIANSIDVPAIEFSGRSQPTPPVNNGMLYFDSDLQRFRVYQENAWRDLSSNYIINGTTLTNPLVIDGYLDTRNIYINENASISKNLNVQGNINSSGTTTVTSLNTDKVLKVPTSASTTLGVGSIYYDTTAGKLKAYNGTSWDIVGKDITVDSAMSSTSTNPVQNKVIYNKIYTLNTNMLASLSAGLDAAEASATRLVNTASSSFDTKLQNASSSLNTQFNNAITGFDNSIKAYVSEKLGSGTSDLWVKSIKTTNASVTNKLDAYDLQISRTLIIPTSRGRVDDYLNKSQNGACLSFIESPYNSIAYTYYPGSGDFYYTKQLSTMNETVSSLTTGLHDGTIIFTRNGEDFEVPVKGLGSAAYANVASFSTAGAANTIPTTQPTNPVAGSIYWNVNGSYLRIYSGSSWYNIYPQANPSAIQNENYIQNAMHSYDYTESGNVRYDFTEGIAITPDNQTCYYPMLQESNDGTTFSDVTGYKRGHFYCVGHELVSSNEIKVTVLFPISSLGEYHYATENDINNLIDDVASERGNPVSYAYGTSQYSEVYHTRIHSIGNYGVFGTGSGKNFNYHNKYYRFNFATTDTSVNPNIMRYDSNFSLSPYINYKYTNSSIPDYANGTFRITGTFSQKTNTTLISNQTYYYGVGVWVEIILRLTYGNQ